MTYVDPDAMLAVLLAAYDAADRETARRMLYELLVANIRGDAMPRDPRVQLQTPTGFPIIAPKRTGAWSP